MKKKCQTCDGCGQIANDEEGTPWSYWTDLPVASQTAIRLGIVKPLLCPDCKGAGEVEENNG